MTNASKLSVLDNKGSAMCSSGYSQPMRCPIAFKDKLEDEKSINARALTRAPAAVRSMNTKRSKA